MASNDARAVTDTLQIQVSSSEELQLRKDILEAEVKISHGELQKQKMSRQLLEEQLKTLECQILDSTAEKEEIRSLLKDLAAQTLACTRAQEQVQKALKDMAELGAANGALKVDEGRESTTQVQDMLLELQQSNDAVKALLTTSCDDLHRQRVQREKLEAKLRSVECQLSDATKQDELKTLLQHFALYTAANLNAEASIRAVLNDLEALKASKDLEVAIAFFMGEAKTALAAKPEEKLFGQALPDSVAPNSADDSEAPGALAEVPRPVAAARYDLREPRAFARFLQDSNIRLVRAKYLCNLARCKQPLPRRQEADFREFVFDGKAESALVRHAEVQNWAEGARTATICSVSHAWETREHPDPCRYQLEHIADRAVWYEAAFETEVWIFYDYVSLFQYERFFSEEERSFRAAMNNMHVMYSHECTMTFRLESLTPEGVWESTMGNDQELIPVWDVESKSIKSKPLKSLVQNRTAYLKRGWCIGEISWSSLRTYNSQNQCIDGSGSDKVEPDEEMEGAEFTHRDHDLPIVIALQEKIFEEKVAVCEHLVLKGLPAQEILALADALPLYRSLKSLKLDTFECSEEAAEAFGKARVLVQCALATSKVVSLELVNPRPGSGAFMGKAVLEALRTNQSLTDIKAEDFDPTAEKAWFKLQRFRQVLKIWCVSGDLYLQAFTDLHKCCPCDPCGKAVEQAFRKNRSIKDRLPQHAEVRLKVVAEALERNSMVTNITVNPDDEIDDQGAKAVAELLKTSTSVKSVGLGESCISDDGAKALAEALRWNQTLEELWLHKDQITDVGAEALAEALIVNKTLRSLTVETSWEALRAVEEVKRDRGEDFQFISAEDDKKEAERCNGDIVWAAKRGNVGAMRHLLRTKPSSAQQAEMDGETPLHCAADNGRTEVVELLVAAKAPLDAKNEKGWTPLHRAARDGHAEVVQLLLKSKAQVDVKKKEGRTPLHLAAANGHTEVVKLLVEVASLAVQDDDGDTPLHDAAELGKTKAKLRWTRRERQGERPSSGSSKPPKMLQHSPRTNEGTFPSEPLKPGSLMKEKNFTGHEKGQDIVQSESIHYGKFLRWIFGPASSSESGHQTKVSSQDVQAELNISVPGLGAAPTPGDAEVPVAAVQGPRPVPAAQYDLREPRAFAQFLQDSNIRLVRAKYLNDLAQSKRPLPRRQEAEFREFVFDGKAESALVRHEEVQNWAAGARTAIICSVSHAWETREHPDPCRYQLEHISDRAVWYETAFKTDLWIFYDYVSLFQYERLFSEEERSFRAAMNNMHVMYAHECTMTFRLESLTPKDVWESTMKNDQELIPVWDVESKSMISKPLKSLVENRIEYLCRGWCIGEISWSSLRTYNSQNQCIDGSGSDKVEPDTPAKFKEEMEGAKFTHRDHDLPIVIALQEKIFEEKVAVCEHLVLEGLPEQEIFALADALPLHRSLKTLKLDCFECSEEAAEAFGKALATSQVVRLELINPRLGSGLLMGKAVIEALRTNQSLTDIKIEDFDDPDAKKAWLRGAVAEALERNSLTDITMDPEYDQIGDEEAKAVAQLLKTRTSVKTIDLGDTCISDDGAQALADALRCNQTLEELCLHQDQITEVGAEALAKALKDNKTLRCLAVAASWEVLRGDFRCISMKDKFEAEGCDQDIFTATQNGNVGAVRHLLRTEPSSAQQAGKNGDTPLHDAARNGRAAVAEMLLAANAPLDVQNEEGKTPLDLARENDKSEVVQLLEAAQAVAPRPEDE
eukprot:s202_g36.t1